MNCIITNVVTVGGVQDISRKYPIEKSEDINVNYRNMVHGFIKYMISGMNCTNERRIIICGCHVKNIKK